MSIKKKGSLFNSCSDPVTFGYVLLGTFWDKLILSANWAHYDFFPVFGFSIFYLFIYLFFDHALNRANNQKKKKKERKKERMKERKKKHTHRKGASMNLWKKWLKLTK